MIEIFEKLRVEKVGLLVTDGEISLGTITQTILLM